MPSIVIGSDNFAEYIQPENLFVDKTLFIKEIIDNKDKVLIITRPRRWAKTLNSSTLQHFFAAEVNGIPTADMFKNLKIAAVDDGRYIRDYQGKYPVIFFSFKDVDGANYEKACSEIGLLISDLFKYHKDDIFNSLDEDDKARYTRYIDRTCDEPELKRSLEFLTKCLYTYHKQKVYVLIDEYDRPLNTAFGQDDSFRKLSRFMGPLFGSCLKSNPYLEKGIVTGIFRIAKAGIFSELNNAREYTLFERKFSEYYGFTEEEVDALCSTMHVEESLRKEVREWYNGYNIGGVTIYNPWSIMSFLSTKKFKAYWVDTSNNLLIKQKIRSQQEIYSNMDKLLVGQTVEVELDEYLTYEQINFDGKNPDKTIWSLFLHTGYLTIESKELTVSGNYICQLRIPNWEIHSLYIRDLADWMQEATGAKFPEFLDCLIKGDVAGFLKGVNYYLSIVFNFKDLAIDKSEAFYHGFVGTLAASLWDKYQIESNRTGGDGFPDLVFIPRKPTEKTGFIIEVKCLKKGASSKVVKSTAKKALEQIDIRNYANILKDHRHVERIFKIAMVFSGKQVFAEHSQS